MSTEIAIVLFVIGAGALVLSVVVDRRPSRPKHQVVLDVEAEAEALEAPPAPEPAPMRAGDEASAAEARLAQLRAELTRGPEPAAEPVAPVEPATRTDAGRVFAAVAAVGRAPEGELSPAPESISERAVEQPSPRPAEVAASLGEGEGPSGAGHTHAVPLVNHSDLVSHMRREHAGLESRGSTIQMRLLHEGAHAASGAARRSGSGRDRPRHTPHPS